MIDFKNFKIKRGPSKDLHDPRLLVEEGYWYLSTDKAELFIGIIENGTPVLKPINGDLIPEVELYDDTELRNLINSKADSVHGHEEYALAEHTHDEYLTEHQSLADYAKKTDLFSKSYNDLTDTPAIPSIEGLATEKYVDGAIAAIQEPVEQVKTTLTTTVLPKVEKVDEIVPIVEEIEPTVGELKTWVENKEYLQDIDLGGYATEDYVTEAIKNIEIPEAEIYKVDFNAPDYTKAVEAYNNGKVLVLINAAPDINSYAVMNYVSEKYITFTKFLTSRSEAYGSFNTYYLSPANT
jgi:hypothetical protein